MCAPVRTYLSFALIILLSDTIRPMQPLLISSYDHKMSKKNFGIDFRLTLEIFRLSTVVVNYVKHYMIDLI